MERDVSLGNISIEMVLKAKIHWGCVKTKEDRTKDLTLKNPNNNNNTLNEPSER